MKTCPKCGASKPPTDFARRAERGCGRQSHCKVCRNATMKRKRDEDRHLILAHYSTYDPPACDCCGEELDQFLTLDHIAGDGAEMRREVHPVSGPLLYSWIIANGFPPIFQVLCWNCNLGRHKNGGECPHVTERQRMEISDPNS